jgi:hypothetical protein
MRGRGAMKSLRNSIRLSCARDWHYRRSENRLPLFCRFFGKTAIPPA